MEKTILAFCQYLLRRRRPRPLLHDGDGRDQVAELRRLERIAAAFSAIAAPAEKLSPAPQISTGYSTRRGRGPLDGIPRSTISAPSPPWVTISNGASMCLRRAGKSTRPRARTMPPPPPPGSV